MPANGSHSLIGNGVRSTEETIDDRETLRPKTDNAVDFQRSFQPGDFAFAFDQDLQTSRVYTRAAKEQSNLSRRSGAVQSFSWSMISGISLSAVSNISVLSLPISPKDLWNGQHYSSESQLRAYTVTFNGVDKQSWAVNKVVSLNDDELCREEETLRQIVRTQREIDKESVELLLCETRLRELEARLLQEQQEVEEKELQELEARLFREQQGVEEDTMSIIPELQISPIYELASVLGIMTNEDIKGPAASTFSCL